MLLLHYNKNLRVLNIPKQPLWLLFLRLLCLFFPPFHFRLECHMRHTTLSSTLLLHYHKPNFVVLFFSPHCFACKQRKRFGQLQILLIVKVCLLLMHSIWCKDYHRCSRILRKHKRSIQEGKKKKCGQKLFLYPVKEE